MKILFVDIDGVLKLNADDTLNRVLMDNLNRVLDTTGAKVVISSDWRKSHSINSLLLLFQDAGFLHDIVGKTDDNIVFTFDDYNGDGCDVLPRGTVIRNWVYSHDVYKFAVVDDIDVGGGIFTTRTDPKKGLTDDIADKLIQLLQTD